MDMRVDQARHQRAPPAVYGDGTWSRGSRAFPNFLDQVSFDQPVGVFDELLLLAVEDVDVSKEGLRLGRLLCCQD